MALEPRRVGDLLALRNLEGKRDNPAELIGVLVGLNLAEPAMRAGAEPIPQAIRFNHVAFARLSQNENLGRTIAAASHAMGAGAPCTLFDLFVAERVQAGEGEARIDDWVHDMSGKLDTEGRGHLREVFSRALSVRMPILRAQGVF
jgi:hypothetical protein